MSAPVSSEVVDVDREPTTEPIRGVRDDDQAIVVEQPERVQPERVQPERVRPAVVRPAVVRPAVVLPEELSVVDPSAVLEDRDVLATTIPTAPVTVGGQIRTGGSEVDVDGPNVRGE